MTKYDKCESDGLWSIKKIGWTVGEKSVRLNMAGEMNGIDEFGHLGGWYIKSTLYMRILNWNKISPKK